MKALWLRVLCALALSSTVPLLAQSTTTRLQGVVRDASGPMPGVTVTAVGTDSGLTRSTVTGADGVYGLVLEPGTYGVSAGLTAADMQKVTIRLQVGQTIESNFELKPGQIAAAVSVSGEAAPEIELRSTEVATNVSTEQIARLPQATRNFLNFAALAPGVNVSHDETRQEFSYGAQGASNTNVFIDGTTFKNDVLQGGAVGQDSSRGNPFPQNAVQEFRVITQNYKAEYQKASSAIISAITKSGANDLHGDVFALYQNKNLVSQDKFSEARGEAKPEYTRWQPGIALGGPIVKDKLHFFASYEGNYQDREASVFLGDDLNYPAAFRNQFVKYTGLFTQPFRSSLFFGKISANMSQGSTLDVSGDLRRETDIRDFGGLVSREGGVNLAIDVATVRVKHTALLGTGKYLNEATASYQDFKWNPGTAGSDAISQNYERLLTIGGRPGSQDISQKRLSLRDDLSLLSLHWLNGDHVVKGGLNFDYLKYHVIKYQDANPQFVYRSSTFITTPGDMPYKAVYGFGNPDISTDNRQFGIYLQDDWRITSRFTANIGLRWDFETDMLNNSYVTPANVRAGFGSVYPSNYFTDGSNRSTDYGAVQPRIGFSFDMTGDGRTIAYGGYGKYYDRTLYNDILDEKFRLQFPRYEIYFSADGGPQDGRPAVKWDPSYLSAAGLNGLIARGSATPEVYLLDNNTKAPSSDQWSVGVRHAMGLVVTSLSYAGVYSKNQITYTCGIKNPDGTCNFGARPAAAQGLGFSLISRSKEGWYHSGQLVVEKQFSGSSPWGARLAYVYAKSQQTGNDLFSFQLLDPIYGTRQRSPGVQTHSINFSAITNLPLGFQASTLISLGSGFPFFVTDCSRGFDKCVDMAGGGDPPKWTESVDLRLEKRFTFGRYDAGVSVQAVNVFDFVNETGYQGFEPALPEVNANFAKATAAYNPRRIEFGVSFRF